MDHAVGLDGRYTVAKFAPRAGDFPRFAEAGFSSVVNMRTESEAEGLSPAEEGRLAREAGLAYLHYPVKGDALSPAVVDEFRRQVSDLPGPVLVHCASGKRSGALMMMHLASEAGLTGGEAVENAADLGLVEDAPDMQQFMKTYVEERAGPHA